MAQPTFTLYHNNWSICSIMVRYTFALRGKPKDNHSDIHITEKHLDLRQNDQYTEDFLCNVNPKGQVPALVPDTRGPPIADSLDITLYLADMYPTLMHADREADIKYWLKELHALNYLSLSYNGQRSVLTDQVKWIEQKMNGDVSLRYKEALQYKLEIFQTSKVDGSEPDVVQDMKDRTKDLLQKLERLLISMPVVGSTEQLDEQWLWGLPHPTALDAHLIVFIARLVDVSRQDLIPERLISYARNAMVKKEWLDVMGGRKTTRQVMSPGLRKD